MMPGKNEVAAPRFIDCEKYDECLTFAAKKNLEMDCRPCESYKPMTPKMSYMEFIGCQRLLRALFADTIIFRKW